jgi:hypothetical protein
MYTRPPGNSIFYLSLLSPSSSSRIPQKEEKESVVRQAKRMGKVPRQGLVDDSEDSSWQWDGKSYVSQPLGRRLMPPRNID